ncbi:hypothetical protein [Streptomyces misionensis]|uniref:hypothetical protein n=1 Tax=Streptomyces misionensis TaxID=67331 RepID=UPI003680EF16
MDDELQAAAALGQAANAINSPDTPEDVRELLMNLSGAIADSVKPPSSNEAGGGA